MARAGCGVGRASADRTSSDLKFAEALLNVRPCKVIVVALESVAPTPPPALTVVEPEPAVPMTDRLLLMERLLG